jgi:hypothetical protein
MTDKKNCINCRWYRVKNGFCCLNFTVNNDPIDIGCRPKEFYLQPDEIKKEGNI